MVEELILADPDRWSGEFSPIVHKLDALLHRHPKIRTWLHQSIKQAQKHGPGPKMNPVENLQEYKRFVDRSADLLPRDVLEQTPYPLRDHMLQACNYFYFLIDQPIDGLKGRGLYKPALQYYPPFGEWVREFSDTWGQFLSTEASWDRDIYRQFYDHEAFGLQKDWYEPASFWDSFNRFFSRYLRNPDQRPIAHQQDDTVITSPADSVPQGSWNIDANSNITVDGSEDIKGLTKSNTYSVDTLLGPDSDFHGAFANGTFTHTFLNVNDYHRYHFPVDGVVKEVNQIPGNGSIEVGWDPKRNRYTATDTTGWQFAQTRGSVVLENETLGLVGFVPIGMAHVSSVNFEDRISGGNRFRKGDMFGHFLYGGSDIVMLFQEQAGFELTATPGDHVTMGQQYGSASLV